MKASFLTRLTGLFLLVNPVPVAFAPVEGATYRIDPVHSELSCCIRHLTGRGFGPFTDWEGTVVVDPENLSTADEVESTIAIEAVRQ